MKGRTLNLDLTKYLFLVLMGVGWQQPFPHLKRKVSSSPYRLAQRRRERVQPTSWTKQAKEAFKNLKEALCKYPVVHASLPDKPFIVYIDASSVGLGAVLLQETPVGEHHKMKAHGPWTKICCH